MDAYYAQVEMKKHNIDQSKPCAVQQWNGLIALNYAAKNAGIKRGMNCYEALAVVPNLILIHVSTFEVSDDALQQEQLKSSKIPEAQPATKTVIDCGDSDSDDE